MTLIKELGAFMTPIMATLALVGPLSAEGPRLPQIEAANLNGRPINLPSQLPGRKTLLLIAFQQDQQDNLDTWIRGMELNSLRSANIAWLELPVIDNPGPIGRWVIDNGMRGGIADPSARAHVVTIYADKAKFNAAMKIDTETTVYAMVATRDGRILARADGDYTKAKAAAILGALQP